VVLFVPAFNVTAEPSVTAPVVSAVLVVAIVPFNVLVPVAPVVSSPPVNVLAPPIEFAAPFNATAKFAFVVLNAPVVVTLPNAALPPLLATDTDATFAEPIESVPEPCSVSAWAPVTAPVVVAAVPAFNVTAEPS